MYLLDDEVLLWPLDGIHSLENVPVEICPVVKPIHPHCDLAGFHLQVITHVDGPPVLLVLRHEGGVSVHVHKAGVVLELVEHACPWPRKQPADRTRFRGKHNGIEGCAIDFTSLCERLHRVAGDYFLALEQCVLEALHRWVYPHGRALLPEVVSLDGPEEVENQLCRIAVHHVVRARQNPAQVTADVHLVEGRLRKTQPRHELDQGLIHLGRGEVELDGTSEDAAIVPNVREDGLRQGFAGLEDRTMLAVDADGEAGVNKWHIQFPTKGHQGLPVVGLYHSERDVNCSSRAQDRL
mmetsp:Transcript_98872/g.229097  ORF Transcript_98872/g.229097 Transcript_98872/m.229097 type:complete len:295 (-) Transcript_98872:1061-1945(-)